MLTPRDMAKIGYLYLHKGSWNGKELVPKKWVEASTSKHMETKGLMNAAEEDGYGYLWWIDPFGFSAHGFGGQYIFVIPQLDMVVVFTGGLADPAFPIPKQLMETYLVSSVQHAQTQPEDPTANQALHNHIKVVEKGEPDPSPLPETAREISGRTYRIAQELTWAPYESFTLTFPGGEIYQSETRWAEGYKLVITGSLNTVFHLNTVTLPLLPGQELLLPLRGHWQDENTFVEEYMTNLTTDIDLIRQTYTFTGNRVTIDVTTSMNLFSGQVIGETVR
jgi:hypothetical protein